MADLFHRVSIRKYQEKKVEPEKLDYNRISRSTKLIFSKF